MTKNKGKNYRKRIRALWAGLRNVLDEWEKDRDQGVRPETKKKEKPDAFGDCRCYKCATMGSWCLSCIHNPGTISRAWTQNSTRPRLPGTRCHVTHRTNQTGIPMDGPTFIYPVSNDCVESSKHTQAILNAIDETIDTMKAARPYMRLVDQIKDLEAMKTCIRDNWWFRWNIELRRAFEDMWLNVPLPKEEE